MWHREKKIVMIKNELTDHIVSATKDQNSQHIANLKNLEHFTKDTIDLNKKNRNSHVIETIDRGIG